jgi:cytidylate kinase
MSKITIAIDGHSSTGKSTVAKQLANHLGYIYVDSGAMYRAITLFAIQNGFIDRHNFRISDLVCELSNAELEFRFNADMGFSEMFLNGKNVEKEIRTMEVSKLVSQVSAIPEVRNQLVKQQHKMGENKGIVMDGRDIGTVVFPNAELKLFMTASADIRAQRRYEELLKRGDEVTFEEILHNIKERDYIDSNREDSPLTQADDAVVIDNSNMSLEEQYEKIFQLVNMTLKDQE